MKQFYSFATGVKICDDTINLWLEQVKRTILAGASYYDTSSGDTYVSAMVWPTMIDFSVATSNGYASIKFANKDELRDWNPNFRRADLLPEKPAQLYTVTTYGMRLDNKFGCTGVINGLTAEEAARYKPANERSMSVVVTPPLPANV